MAKMMVEIDMPHMSYEQLRQRVIKKPDPEWFEDGLVESGLVMVAESILKRSMVDDDYYVFKLIGVRP